jgi:hypothetical protein
MAETIADFFRRHHAVPATDAGPDWSQATNKALLAWFHELAGIVRCGWCPSRQQDATPGERQGQAAAYRLVAAEVQRRAECPDASPEIMGAAFRAASPMPKICHGLDGSE